MRCHFFNILLLLSLTVISASCHPRSSNKGERTGDRLIRGRVIRIIDGDTYDMLTEGNQTLRIRMTGIDAPERGMAYYQVSKNYLGELCFHKNVLVRKTGNNGNRILGFTFLEDGKDAGAEMIRAGMAWHFIKYSSDPELAKLENEAREARRGLWKDPHPMPPWENRRLHQKGISTKGSGDRQ